MKLSKILHGVVQLEIEEREMVLINNALNEILHCVEIPGFDSRIGGSKAEASRLLDDCGRVLDKVKNLPGFGS